MNKKDRGQALSLDGAPYTYVKLPLAKLTDREIECLHWASHGRSNRNIAKILGLSERTVEHHLTSAGQKLAATTRVHAVATALRLGLINGPVHIPE